jgi:O-methyltransferase
MRGILEAFRVGDRTVWVADSFEGLPPPTASPDVALGHDISGGREPLLVASLETVKRTFDAYGLLDGQVKFLKGWFKDTLPSAPIERLAVLRLDGDMYESTRDALVALYDKVSPGGYIIVDDLFLPPCAQAIDEFRTTRGIADPIVTIDWAAGFWRKT